MKIGIVGLGKLGLPVALAIAHKGHEVIGYDKDPAKMERREYEHQEQGIAGEDFTTTFKVQPRFRFGTLLEVCKCDLIFVAVETPHQPQFEGITPLTTERADFDYKSLKAAIKQIDKALTNRNTPIVIISTVLPGTVRREFFNGNFDLKLVYNPFFIAMGTVIKDFLHPEFILLGCDDRMAAHQVELFYGSITTARVLRMSIASAELSKVAYNTFIGMKIVFANTMMEIAHKMDGVNVDDVSLAIKSANRRLVSTSYLDGGMGDGGGCHPRDNIALSWLASQLDLSHNIFDDLMMAREHQTKWLVELMRQHKGPKFVLGLAFKPETNITTGSPAKLLLKLLVESGELPDCYDPYIHHETWSDVCKQAVYLIGCKHEVFRTYEFPKGSVVIDPHRYIKDQEGVTVIRVGE